MRSYRTYLRYCVILALVGVVSGTVQAQANRVTAVYDPPTGYIWLEVNADLAYIQIIDPTGTGQLGPKDPDGVKPFVGFHPLDPAGSLLEDERPHHVGEMNFGGLPHTAGPHLYVEAMPGIAEEDFDLWLYAADMNWNAATFNLLWPPPGSGPNPPRQ